MRLMSALLIGACVVGVAKADPPVGMSPQTEVKAMLAGGWKYKLDGGEPSACDNGSNDDEQVMTFEFEATGGKMSFSPNLDETVNLGVMVGEADAKHVTLTLADGPGPEFEIVSPGVMKATKAPDAVAGMRDVTFRKCFEAADRSKIKVDKDNGPLDLPGIAYLSQGGLGDQPRFVDTRFGKGAKACDNPEQQYVVLDLVGPLDFTMGRYNSYGLAETLVGGGKPKVMGDEVGDWHVEAVEPTADGWKVTATELIPPNGSRGDTTTITIVAKDNLVKIPEWKREYWRCTNEDIIRSPM